MNEPQSFELCAQIFAFTNQNKSNKQMQEKNETENEIEKKGNLGKKGRKRQKPTHTKREMRQKG